MNIKQLLFGLLLSMPAFASYGNLKPEELTLLKQGKQIKRSVMLDGIIWPKVTIISLIPFTPKENMKVFSKFESHKDFIPNLIKSKVLKKNGNETDVAFEMKMPMPVSNSIFKTKYISEQRGEDYKVTWSLIEANQMKTSDGSVLFEAYEGKTLFTYINHINPDSRFAGLFTQRVKSDVEKTVELIITHLKNNNSSN